GGAYLESFGVLSLAEVEAIRRTEAWATYARLLEGLVDRPLELTDPGAGAVAVADAYVRLAQAATGLARRRNPRLRTERWMPALELVVEVGGAALSVIPALLGRDPAACQVAGAPPPDAGGRTLPVSVKLLVRGLRRRGSRADLATGVHLLHGRLENAGEQWRDLLATLQPVPVEDGPLPAERQAVMERSEPDVA
ncbi:MAG TPA: hypothetical protein VOB72_01090, partial [Candidatus Dormibacteraeota bacterium]|nr:hypothetical protein [Candidatus Dormibacteraeota bacterium]